MEEQCDAIKALQPDVIQKVLLLLLLLNYDLFVIRMMLVLML